MKQQQASNIDLAHLMQCTPLHSHEVCRGCAPRGATPAKPSQPQIVPIYGSPQILAYTQPYTYRGAIPRGGGRLHWLQEGPADAIHEPVGSGKPHDTYIRDLSHDSPYSSLASRQSQAGPLTASQAISAMPSQWGIQGSRSVISTLPLTALGHADDALATYRDLHTPTRLH